MSLDWFAHEAKRIFGVAGFARRKGSIWQAGYVSWYGFHLRGEGGCAADALAAAVKSRLSDDPSPADQSWVPGSFSPHVRETR